MPDDERKRYGEFLDRACDALVLGYSPSNVLESDVSRGGFYIPSSCDVEEALGYSLRKIFGQKEGGCHWADSVKWGTIANLGRLEKRILKGTRDVIWGGDQQTRFEIYLSAFSEIFDHIWIFRKGDLYKFYNGKKEEAIQKFKDYWDKQERSRWKEIHKFMREYTKKDFERKSTS